MKKGKNKSMEREHWFQLVDKLADLYVLDWSKYRIAKDSGMFVPKHADDSPVRLTKKTLSGHLGGHYAVSVFSWEKKTKFLSLDVDQDSERTVQSVVYILQWFGIPKEKIYVSDSGGKGYHVEVFFDGNGVWLDGLQRFYRAVLEEIGRDESEVEFRPTGTLSIKLPLGKHSETGRTCWFVDRDTLKPIEDMDYIFRIEKMSSEDMESIIERTPEVDDARIRRMVWGKRKLQPARRVVLQNLPEVTAPGQRHSMMVQVAMQYRQRGYNEKQIVEALMEWYDEQLPNIMSTSREATEKDARRIAWWVCEKISVRKSKFEEDIFETGKVRLSAEEMGSILMCKGGTARKLLLNTLLWGKRTGKNHVSQTQLANAIGTAPRVIRKILPKLQEKNLLICLAGKVGKEGDEFVKDVNTYYIGVLPECGDIPETGKTIEIPIEDVKEDFLRVYYQAMQELLGTEYVMQRLTKPEQAEMDMILKGEHSKNEK